MLRSDNRISPSGLARSLAAIATAWFLLVPPPSSAHARSRRAGSLVHHRHRVKRHGRHGARRHGAESHRRHRAPTGVLLGDATVESRGHSLAAGRSEAFRLRARASGRIAALRLYVGAASTARTVIVGLYSDARGRPGALLGSGTATPLSRGAWNILALTPAPRVFAGRRYWLAILAEGGALRYRASRRGSCLRVADLQGPGALPTSASTTQTPSRASCPVSAYGSAGLAPGLPVNLVAPVLVATAPGSNPLSPASLGPVSPVAVKTKTEPGSPGAEGETPHEEPSPPREEEKPAPPEEPGPPEEPIPPPPASPANSVQPTVGGTLVEGDVLTSTLGTWSGSPTSYSRHWQDCDSMGKACKTIAAAASASYTLAAGDVGHTIRVVVTATNAGGSTTASSKQTGLVAAVPPPPPSAPANTEPPAISGTTTEGQALTASKGSWSGSPTSYAYQWQDCDSKGAGCANIASAVAGAYTLAAGDVGHTIRVVVTATNAGGSTTATSVQTAVVSSGPPPPPPSAPTNTTLPTISGTSTQGQTLNASKGTWTASPTSYAYQWQDCNTSGSGCASIAAATSGSYALAAGDVGHTIRVVVTATNAGGSTPATSAASAIVAASSGGGSSYPPCTQTLSQGANIAGAVSGAAAGSVICLSSGAYGNLTLDSSHSGDVTLQAAPAAHVTAGKLILAGSHMVVRGLWLDGEVALEAGASFMTIDRDDITGGGEGIVFDTSDCTVPNAPTWSGCEPQAPITDVTISHNRIHDIGENGSGEDAIHLDNWRRVSIVGNELTHIIEAGDHTDCMQSVYGGEQLVFERNYEHDNDCQGFFVKDGDATHVTFSDNLFLRDQIGTYANFAQIWNVQDLTIQHNTIWDGKGLALVTEDASFTPTATIDHNVISNMSVEPHAGPAYAITEGQDIFGEAPNKLSEGTGDSVIASPKFKETATDDYRLASNPNGIGVNWSPTEQQYGPAS